MGNGGNHPLAAGTAPPQARHFGIDTCFVKEHDPADPLGMGREPGLTLAPNHACCLPIRAFLFTGVGGFFKADLARAEPVINRRSRRNHLVNFVQTLRQLLQCRVWRLLNPAQDILAVKDQDGAGATAVA